MQLVKMKEGGERGLCKKGKGRNGGEGAILSHKLQQTPAKQNFRIQNSGREFSKFQKQEQVSKVKYQRPATSNATNYYYFLMNSADFYDEDSWF